MFFAQPLFLKRKLRNFFIGKFSDFSYPEHFKRYLQHFFVRTRNNLDKIWSSFGEMSEKDIFNTKQKYNIFLWQKFPIFPIWKISKDVFRTLLWGPETVRKKYRVGFEIFPKRLFFLFSGKKVAKFFYWNGTF